ncbi:type I-E CRISPR-associated protein Cse1/CasA [Corynebacterium flavescens]|uniref:type I-E CRISPR-associated protein Cse1/CasA n=1 Tax=Corynebacterium flavescens TaxID=28028 RepID=UPI003FD5B7CA
MFSLIDKPWIIVQDSGGETLKLGLRDIFSGEYEIDHVCGESRMQDYAITRLLLAIFWRAHGGDAVVSAGQTFRFTTWFEDAWEDIAQEGSDPEAIAYLEKYAERFDLLDPVVPFMQVPDLHLKDGSRRPVVGLIPEIQDSYFTMRAGRDLQDVSLDEAARWLVYTQAFDYSGIKSGAVDDKRVKGGKGYPIGQGWTGLTGGTLIKGETLLHTLVLNTVEHALSNPEDKPVWERDPDGPGERKENSSKSEYPMGAADLATWQSRRIRLFVEDDRVTEILICNGDRIPDAGANIMADPMTPYRWSKNKSTSTKDVYYPRPYDLTRTMWRSLDALIVAETDGGFSAKDKRPKRPKTLDSLAALSADIDDLPAVLDTELYSVEYGPQASSVATNIHASIGLPLKMLLAENVDIREAVRTAAANAMDVAKELGVFGGNLLVAAGGEYGFHAQLTDRFLAALEPSFVSWLRDLSLPAEGLLAAISGESARWQEITRDLAVDYAKEHLRGAGPKAFAGRIVKQNQEDLRGRVISAGSVYSQLIRKLNLILPATKPAADTEPTREPMSKEENR